MTPQAVVFLLCILVAFGGVLVCAAYKAWATALAFLVVALFVLGYAWPVLT